MDKSSPLKVPKGREPKSQIAIRPKLAEAFRYLAKKERIQLSSLLSEMIALWLNKNPKYPDVRAALKNDD